MVRAQRSKRWHRLDKARECFAQRARRVAEPVAHRLDHGEDLIVDAVVASGSLIEETERLGIGCKFVQCLSATNQVDSKVIEHGTP